MGLKCNWSHPLLSNHFFNRHQEQLSLIQSLSYNTANILKQTDTSFLPSADNLNLTSKAKFKVKKITLAEEQETRESYKATWSGWKIPKVFTTIEETLLYSLINANTAKQLAL